MTLPPSQPKCALIAGTHSGSFLRSVNGASLHHSCGKTTVTLALLQTLQAAGVAVTASKAGLDFIDPLWHQAASGGASESLDTRMMGEALCRQRFQVQAAQFSCIEGVMGLFDGRGPLGGTGSSAHLAALLKVPVWLVVDAGGLSSSIAAKVAGNVDCAARSGSRIAGVIANRVGGAGHAAMRRDTLDEQQLPPLLAWLRGER